MNHSLFGLFLLVIFFCFTISPVQTLTISGYGIKDLESNDPVLFQKEADWWNLTGNISSGKITQTTTTQKWLLGGPGILKTSARSPFEKSFSRTYTNLPAHSFVTISAIFWVFDTFGGVFNNSAFSMATENGNVWLGPQLSPTTEFTVEDGGITGVLDLIRDHFQYGTPHFSSSLTLILLNMGSLRADAQSFGFRELHIHLSNSSAPVFLWTCHISEDVPAFQWQKCPCPVGQAQDSSGNCTNCTANCDSCSGTAPDECLVCSAGAYWDGNKCNTCHLMCQTCTGVTSNDCPSCKYGFYNYGNNTCMESCEPPFEAEQIGIELFCNPKCSASQFYWIENNACWNKCEFPLIHAKDANGIEVCSSPCSNKNHFLYSNGSCYPTCQAPLLLKTDLGVKFCVNPCSETDYYLYPNRSCLSSCSAPLLSRSEPGAKYCWNPCPSVSNYLFQNGSCETTCPAPLVSRSEPGFRYCETPCDSVDDYIYDNRSCANSCSPPLVSRIEPFVARYCYNPCPSSSNYFLYPNGSCLTECNWPLLIRSEPGVQYCFSPCASSAFDYIYPNGTCKEKCPLPLMTRIEPDFNYCFSPCKGHQYLFDDQSCSNECESPLLENVESGGIKYCNTPCTEYVYPDGMCRPVCEYPYKVVGNSTVYKICSIKMDEVQIHQAYSLADLIDITNAICGAGGLFTGFVIPGDPNSMLMWSLLKMLQSSRFMDVNFPTFLTKIYAKENNNYLGNDGFLPSDRRRVLTEGENLGKFTFYNISGNFLENYWQQLVTFGVLMILLAIAKILLCLLTNPSHIKLAKYLNSALQWNVVTMFFCGTYGDLVFSSALEFQTFSLNNLGSIVGFLTCLVMTILAVYIPIKILYAISNIRKTPSIGEEGAEMLWDHNRVFFEAYKSEHIIQHAFLLIYLVRVALFNIIIGFLWNSSPLIQAILVNFISFGMIVYLLSKTPTKSKLCLAQHIVMESTLFAYNLCLLILIFMDIAGAQTESTRAFFGGIMVFIMIMAPLVSAVLILLKLSLRVQELHRQYKAQKEALGFVRNGLQLKKARASGNLRMGQNHTENFESLNLTESHNNEEIEAEIDDSNSIVIPQNHSQEFARELSRNYYLPSGWILRNWLESERNSVNIHLESNAESSFVETKIKEESGLKRKKIDNVFKNDDYLPD